MDKNTYVYCTRCKHFSCDEEGPQCPYEEKCSLWDPEDSRPRGERPFYEEEKEY